VYHREVLIVHPICYYVGGQAPEYRDNKIHTGWLDSRIAMRVRVERPPWHLSVVGGALYVSATECQPILGFLCDVTCQVQLDLKQSRKKE
jgi:hypothetical protein